MVLRYVFLLLCVVLPYVTGECLYAAVNNDTTVHVIGIGPSGGKKIRLNYPVQRLSLGETFDVKYFSSNEDENRVGFYDASSGEVIMFAPGMDPKEGGEKDERYVAYPPARAGARVTAFALDNEYFFLAYDTVNGSPDLPLIDIIEVATGKIHDSVTSSKNIVGPISKMQAYDGTRILINTAGKRLMSYDYKSQTEYNFSPDMPPMEVSAIALHHRDQTIGILSGYDLFVYTKSGTIAGEHSLPSKYGPIRSIEFNDGVPGFIWYTTDVAYATAHNYARNQELRLGDTTLSGVIGILVSKCPAAEWENAFDDTFSDVTGSDVIGGPNYGSSKSNNTVVIVVPIVVVLLLLLIIIIVVIVMKNRRQSGADHKKVQVAPQSLESGPSSYGGTQPLKGGHRVDQTELAERLTHLARLTESTTPSPMHSRSLLNSMASQPGTYDSLTPGPSVHVSSMLGSNGSSGDESVSRSATDKAYRKIPLSEVTVGECIGSGGFANVFRGQWHGIDVAIKVFRNATVERAVDEFYKEMGILAHLRHPHIVLLLGGDCSDDGIVSIVTELKLGGSLFDLLQDLRDERRFIHYQNAWRLSLDIAAGMQYLHSDNPPIVHRDLKSLNILLDEHGRASVADFGLSRVYDGTGAMTKAVGTPAWMAPELIIRSDKKDVQSVQSSVQVDVFSYAVVLWELVTGSVPWEDIEPVQLIGRYIADPAGTRLVIPSYVPDVWRKLIEMCWANDPAHRPVFSDIIAYLQQHADELQVDPPRRDAAHAEQTESKDSYPGLSTDVPAQPGSTQVTPSLTSGTRIQRAKVVMLTTQDEMEEYLSQARAGPPSLA